VNIYARNPASLEDSVRTWRRRGAPATRRISDLPVPEELRERFRRDPPFKRAFEALTPGRQRSYLDHFAAAKQSATRRIEKGDAGELGTVIRVAVTRPSNNN